MKWVKRTLISLAILVLVGAGGFALYSIAYARGETAGYDNGYSVGHEAGYSSGKQDGYDEGYVSGEREGYDKGYISGKATGYADGYEEGYDEGVEASLGHGYTLRDPTYTEAVAFLKADKTNENKYIEDGYVCSHFARDISNNAEAEGLRCAIVVIRFLDVVGGDHLVIAFETIDKGLVYFEPQFDDEVQVTLGKSFSQMNSYQESSFDDTIMDIVVIW